MTQTEQDFCRLFRCDISEGRKYYKRIPMANTFDDTGQSIMNLTCQEEVGVRIDLTTTDFDRLLVASIEGGRHKSFRSMHPSAQALYDQYMTLYHLTNR